MPKRSHTGWTYVVLGLSFFLSTLLAPFLWKEPQKSDDVAGLPRSPRSLARAEPASHQDPRAKTIARNKVETPPIVAEPEIAITEESPAPERALIPEGPPSPTAMAQEVIELDPSVSVSTPADRSDSSSSEPATAPAPRALSTSENATPMAPSEPPPAPRAPESLTEERPTPIPEAPEAKALRGQAWPVAESLEQQLATLAERNPLAKSWTERVNAELHALSLIPTLADPAAAALIERLHKITLEAKAQANRPERYEGRSLVLRACYALQRRLEIWKTVAELEARGETARPIALTREEVQQSIVGAAVMFKQNPEEAGWKRYLLLAEAAQILPQFAEQPQRSKQLAREILRRFHSPQLEIRQEQLLLQAPTQALEKVLRRIATEGTDRVALLKAIEAYETNPLTREAAKVADTYDRLRWSANPDDIVLGTRLGIHYRNANVRVALTEELVNRLLPKDQWSRDAVNDNILGADVQGQSTTYAQVKLMLVPDGERWRLGVQASGHVASSTASSKGPATFYQDGYSNFRAQKMLLIDRSGVRLYRAEAAASASSQLRDYETGYDNIPLFGAIARSVAKNAYEEQSAWAKGEIEDRIANQASMRLDQEVRKQVESAQKEVYSKLIDPLNELRLDPTPVEFETTAERLIARYRVAGKEQLAAHTPRPQAPAGSLLSVQVHQTSLNNLFDHLEFDGKRTDIQHLFADLSKQFHMQEMKLPEDMPEGVEIEFAAHDSVRLDCIDNRVRITVRLAELSQGGRKWKNFAVRAYYKPDATQLHANLVRDGAIELPEGKLSVGDQIALRGVFSKVLSKHRPFNLINSRIATAPALQGLKVTQFYVDDGWMAVAIGYPEELNARRLQKSKAR